MNNLNEKRIIYLYPGDIYITNRDLKIYTLLGSCVAIIFYSSKLKTGGICHSLLPEKLTSYKNTEKRESNYVDFSFYFILNKFLSMGISKKEIEIALIGGSNTFSNNSNMNIGKRNIEKAILLINKEGLKLKSNKTSGNKCRKIIFYPKEGIIKGNYCGKNIYNKEINIEKYKIDPFINTKYQENKC